MLKKIQLLIEVIKLRNLVIKNIKMLDRGGADITLLVPNSDRMKVFKELQSALQKKFGFPFVAPSTSRKGKDLLALPKVAKDDLTRVKILIKPEPGSKPKADDHESLSTYCIANAFAGGKDFSFETLKKLRNVDALPLKDVLKKCGSDWRQSSARHGMAVKKYFPKLSGKYTFLQRGGKGKAKWISKLYNRFKVLRNELNITLNDDKWDPADMWIVHDSFLQMDFKKFTSLKDLNSKLVQLYKSAQNGKPGIIGISLKKMEKDNVKYFVGNVDKSPKQIKNITTNYSTFLTKFTTITFDLIDGKGTKDTLEMAVRPFTNAESSGELKGKGSLAGKVGITEINRLFKLELGKEVERRLELETMFNRNPKKFFELFYERYKPSNSLPTTITNPEELRAQVTMKLGDDIDGYYMGKFQAVSICRFFDEEKDEEKRNRIMMGMYAYASSTTDNSGPYLKVSN